MALTRDFKETVQEMARTDPEFRRGLLTEAARCLFTDELPVAKVLLRDYVNATLGFAELGLLTGKKPQSLMRMLSANGNPSLENIALIMSSLRTHEGIEFRVLAE